MANLPPNRACQRCGMRSVPTRQQTVQWHVYRLCGRCWARVIVAIDELIADHGEPAASASTARSTTGRLETAPKTTSSAMTLNGAAGPAAEHLVAELTDANTRVGR